MKKFMTCLLLVAGALHVFAQQKPAVPAVPATTPAAGSNGAKQGPKPYKEIITDKAISKKGLFTVHKVEDKWYFEIADSILNLY